MISYHTLRLASLLCVIFSLMFYKSNIFYIWRSQNKKFTENSLDQGLLWPCKNSNHNASNRKPLQLFLWYETIIQQICVHHFKDLDRELPNFIQRQDNPLLMLLVQCHNLFIYLLEPCRVYQYTQWLSPINTCSFHRYWFLKKW